MLEIASQIVICLLIAALIGFIIGYLVAKSSSKKTTPVPTEEVSEKEETLVIEKNEDEEVDSQESEEIGSEKPELLSSPRNDEKDKLTEIKGIGPKVEKKLNEAGIYHFEQIANWSDANIKWLEINTTFAHRAIKDLWVTQAKSLS